MFEGLKDMGKLLKQAKEMKSQMQEVQKKLKESKFLGINKEGEIKIALTGELDCIGVKFDDPSIINVDNQKKLEKALQEAFNDAAQKAKTAATSSLSGISKGMDIPGLTT